MKTFGQRAWLRLPQAAGLFAIFWATALAAQAACAEGGGEAIPRELELGERSYDIGSESGLAALAEDLRRQIDEADAQLQQRARERARLLDGRPLQDLSAAEIKAYYAQPPSLPDKQERRGLEMMHRLTQAAFKTRSSEKQVQLRQLTEIAAALENGKRPPVPVHVDGIAAPLIAWQYYYHPLFAPPSKKPGERNAAISSPGDSTFWVHPRALETLDLSAGFGRKEQPDFSKVVWSYAGPKKGYGTSPGFELRAEDLKVKVKFAETHSEPFAARIFAALGYQVEPTDHVRSLRIRYDRRLLREFDLRREVSTKVTTFLIPTYTIRIQKRFDPFAFIRSAVLKDGRPVSPGELKEMLFYNPRLEHPEDFPTNFIASVEQQIDCLLTTGANVHSDPNRSWSVGPWDFAQLDHATRHELRGLALLAAWIGWFDCRFINTRLEVLETADGFQLRHAITDLGSCLGRTSGLFSRMCEDPEGFPWTFTRPARFQGKGRMTIPFRIVGYNPIELPRSFRRMDLEDARWMGNLIQRLSKRQIADALAAAGFEQDDLELLLEKLLSRRAQMLRDLGLSLDISKTSQR